VKPANNLNQTNAYSIFYEQKSEEKKRKIFKTTRKKKLIFDYKGDCFFCYKCSFYFFIIKIDVRGLGSILEKSS
jgi:hypothetical protein